MIALVHQAGWSPRRATLKYGRGCEHAFEDTTFDSNTEFTDAPIDYLLGPTKRVYQRKKEARRAA